MAVQANSRRYGIADQNVGDRYRAWGWDQLLVRGVAAGVFAGIAFMLANMWYAVSQGKPAIAPLVAISTVFRGNDAPIMEPASRVPQEAIVGLVTHGGLSVLFALIFALLVPLATTRLLLAAGGLVYGLALYLVNFQFWGRFVFEWFTDPRGPNQVFELIIHPLAYGLFLVPFFLGGPFAHRGWR